MAEKNEGKFKPEGYKPVGWHFREIFVDDEGNVFRRGEHCPEEKGTLPHSRETDDSDGTREGNPFKEPEEIKEKTAADLGMDAKEDPPVVDESESPENLSKEDFDKLVSDLHEQFDEKWRAREKAMQDEFQSSLARSGTGGISTEELGRAIASAEQYKVGGHHYRDVRDLDPNDFDERGAIFTSYGNGYLIVDDTKKDGFAVPTPYGRLFKFRFANSKIVKIGKTESYSSYCTFRTHSKKEIDWLRNHSRFNIEFFENINLALSANARKAQIAAKVWKMVSSLDQPEILRRAKAYDIQIGGELGPIITELAHRMAEEQYQKELKQTEERTISAYEEKHM